MADLEGRTKPREDSMDERREHLLMEIAALWRGDWSGHSFDGKDGARWIDTALHGDTSDLDDLESELNRVGL